MLRLNSAHKEQSYSCGFCMLPICCQSSSDPPFPVRWLRPRYPAISDGEGNGKRGAFPTADVVAKG